MAKYYFVNDNVDPDLIFGKEEVCCLNEEEVKRLSKAWDTDVFQQMHEATEKEMELYGVYNS